MPSYTSSNVTGSADTQTHTDTHTHTHTNTHTHTLTDYSTLALRPRTARLITYCIIKKYNKSNENTDDYYTDIQPPGQINAIYDEVEKQRDPTTTNNPSYQPTILRTEV